MINYVHILDQHKIDILRTNKSHLTNYFLSCMYFSEKLFRQSFRGKPPDSSQVQSVLL